MDKKLKANLLLDLEEIDRLNEKCISCRFTLDPELGEQTLDIRNSRLFALYDILSSLKGEHSPAPANGLWKGYTSPIKAALASNDILAALQFIETELKIKPTVMEVDGKLIDLNSI